MVAGRWMAAAQALPSTVEDDPQALPGPSGTGWCPTTAASRSSTPRRPIVRYPYRGAKIRPVDRAAHDDKDQRMTLGLVESRMRWKPHVRFGERAGETGRRERRHRAPARLHSRLLRLKGVSISDVRFEPDRVVIDVVLRRRRLVCPMCEHSTRHARTRVRSTRSGATSISRRGGWRSAAGGGADLPRAWGARRGRPVRAPRLGVHARLRVLGRVARYADRQEHGQPARADRLGHGRADHRPRLRRRAGPRPAEGRSSTSGSTR